MARREIQTSPASLPSRRAWEGMIVWPNVWTAEPTSHDYRMMHEAREVSKGVKYGANVWLRLYPRGRDERYPVPPLCDMYPHVPECSGDELSKRRRDRVRGRQKRRGGGGGGGGGRATHRHSHSSHAAANSNSSSLSLSLPPYACTRHRDFRANCIRGGGVGCPFSRDPLAARVQGPVRGVRGPMLHVCPQQICGVLLACRACGSGRGGSSKASDGVVPQECELVRRVSVGTVHAMCGNENAVCSLKRPTRRHA